jgi:hypothetical protein
MSDLIGLLGDDDEELWRKPPPLGPDLRAAIAGLAPQEVRYLVDQYYVLQDYRLQAANQVRALTDADEPHRLSVWFLERYRQLERQMQRALDWYTAASPVGVWARAHVGIGPVITAGFLAHIDIAKAPTVGHIWSFAGLNPEQHWAKGEKRPWNARLKVLCWKLGQSFNKFSNHPHCVYGALLRQRKAQEVERNLNELFAHQAAMALQTKKIDKKTDAYKWYSQGQLPPAHLQARAERWVVKLWLAHLHEAWTVAATGQLPRKPYVLDKLGHTTEIVPQHQELIEGWEALRAKR